LFTSLLFLNLRLPGLIVAFVAINRPNDRFGSTPALAGNPNPFRVRGAKKSKVLLRA
jgi:hypothetical protein